MAREIVIMMKYPKPKKKKKEVIVHNLKMWNLKFDREKKELEREVDFALKKMTGWTRSYPEKYFRIGNKW